MGLFCFSRNPWDTIGNISDFFTMGSWFRAENCNKVQEFSRGMVQRNENVHFTSERRDDFQKTVQYNISKYGWPILHAAYGGKWLEDIYFDLLKILEAAQSVPLEIIVKPEDIEAHHWSLEYYVLTSDEDNYGLIRAIDYERKIKEGNKDGKIK